MAVTLRHGAILHSTLPLSSPPVTNGLNEHLCETIIPGTGALAPIVDDAFAAFLSPSPVRSFPPEKKNRSPAWSYVKKPSSQVAWDGLIPG